MKTLFLNIFCLFLAFNLFTSCAENDDVEREIASKVIRSIKILLSDSSSVLVKFDYNNNLDLVGAYLGGIEYNIDYANGEISEHIKRYGESSIYNKHTINKLGFIRSGSEIREEYINGVSFLFTKKYTLNYDNEGYLLTKSTSFYNNKDTPINTVTNFEWIQGEVCRQISVDGNKSRVEIFLYENTDYDNITNLDLNTLITEFDESLFGICALVRRIGETNKKLIASISYRSQMTSGFWDETKYRFEYVVDKDLYPVEIKRYSTFSYSTLPLESVPDEILDKTYLIQYN